MLWLDVYINPEHFPILKGTVIDFVDHGMGAKEMQFKNPNAASLCGCGESFNLLEESDD
jgi:iron-sulfur cluster assembly protein